MLINVVIYWDYQNYSQCKCKGVLSFHYQFQVLDIHVT